MSADGSDTLGFKADSLLHYNQYLYCWNNPINMHDQSGFLPWYIVSAISGATFEVAVYLLTTLIQDKKITINGVGDAALRGALAGIALGALGRGIQILKTALKASNIGGKVFRLSSQALSKALGNPKRLQHAFKHAKDFGFGNWNKTTAK